MKKKPFCNEWLPQATRRLGLALVAAAALAGVVPDATAGVPDWLAAAARLPLPKYTEETNAVVLVDEHVITVDDSGEIKKVVRRAYKILRPQGRDVAFVSVYFDNETRLTYLKAWSIPAQGESYEIKEKDFVETSVFSGVLYEDTRHKIARIPGADPGSIVGYEYEQRLRPYVLQDVWAFQDDIPVRSARYQLRLPKGWEVSPVWINHPPRQANSTAQNVWIWELEHVPAVEREPAMPSWRSVAGALGVTFHPGGGEPGDKSHSSWRDVGQWYEQLAAPSRVSTAEIKQKVSELTTGAATLEAKIAALAGFVQRDVRYVAIEIGIGGYQPHPAPAVFANRYGDCKDKATLLSAMLRELGLDSYYVAVNIQRGAVARNFPSVVNFNHVITAVRLPEGAASPALHAVQKHERLGALLFFDPTDPMTPLGYLPAHEQGSLGLLITPDGGELVELPLLPPAVNRLLRSAELELTAAGILSGEVQEIRWGAPATRLRALLLEAEGPERSKILERFLGQTMSNVQLTWAGVEYLNDFSASLVVRYRFVAQDYAQSAANLLIFRPRALGQKTLDLMEEKERKHPVEFPDTMLDSDIIRIKLPPGYVPDELPAPVVADYAFGRYRSKSTVAEDGLHYERTFEIKHVRIPTERLAELKKFFREVRADEQASAVLKRAAP